MNRPIYRTKNESSRHPFKLITMSDHPDSIRNDVDSLTVSRVIMARTRDSDMVLLM